MIFDPNQAFEKYKILVDTADTAFEKIQADYPDLVKCRVKCSDCCHALFDLTLIEAVHINYQFNRRFSGNERDEHLGQANAADRKIYKIKREAHKASLSGKSPAEIFDNLSESRVRCPLLNADDQCDLYEHRPITCRLYGVPTAIDGKGHTCGLSGFESGQSYPTVNLDTIHGKLYEISLDFIRAIRSKHIKMADMLVPLSMALLTEYNEDYLGFGGPEEDPDKMGDTHE